ncbi:ethanolamine ammonia-lyase subunit EutC [Pseudoduganella ginsengisoli]|uniref:Ethanolamine ammonia-lyase small subunit n=1 Tax=Pseudoduganella ginsengisoli TaxID=1462440 RepID=A0A6L6Q6X1_9BURK|nr:ethanolamine ammonia-lyase subunit EutC [Pseudoduganella ginsengisoli]
MSKPVTHNPWQALRQFTAARIALGRAGVSQPTAPQLDFQLAHAQARDAVHLALDAAALAHALAKEGMEVLCLHSAAPDRSIYLQRPDLGRRLDAESRQMLQQRPHPAMPYEVVFVVADGLSALAIERHALPFLQAMVQRLAAEPWRIGPVVLVSQGRVAVGDEVGELLAARAVVVLVGERPGLSSPDSMGLYLTWQPRVGLTDAARNCISNVRPEGLVYGDAAYKLHYLLSEARRRGLSGVELKDETGAAPGVAQQDSVRFLL